MQFYEFKLFILISEINLLFCFCFIFSNTILENVIRREFEAVSQSYSIKKVLLSISLNS